MKKKAEDNTAVNTNLMMDCTAEQCLANCCMLTMASLTKSD